MVFPHFLDHFDKARAITEVSEAIFEIGGRVVLSSDDAQDCPMLTRDAGVQSFQGPQCYKCDSGSCDAQRNLTSAERKPYRGHYPERRRRGHSGNEITRGMARIEPLRTAIAAGLRRAP